MAELRPAPPEFYQRLQRLIAAYPDDLGHLQGARIEILLRPTQEEMQNVQAWGEADTPDKPSEERRFDFTIWFAWDRWQTLDEYQRDALSFHELMHCAWDDEGKPLLLHHDVEIFNSELAIFGVWWGVDAQATIDALNVMPAPHAPEGTTEMPLGFGGYQKPMRGTHGSSGVGTHGSSGVKVAYSDPGITPGGDFYTVDLGNGEVIELCPACFDAAAKSILNDLLAGLSGA